LDRLVDFGHAVGQNLEMVALGTDQELMHGEAVATDMAFMTVLSNVLGRLSDGDRDRILRILSNCGLPTHHPMLTREFFKEAMDDRIKNSLGMRLPLPVGMGEARMFNDVTDEQFEMTFCLWEKLCRESTVRTKRVGVDAAFGTLATNATQPEQKSLGQEMREQPSPSQVSTQARAHKFHLPTSFRSHVSMSLALHLW